MKSTAYPRHLLFEAGLLLVGILLFGECNANAQGQVLFFDNFEQFAGGTDLTTTNYAPASGPASAFVVTSVQNGSPTIKATNFLGSTRMFFDNSVVTNKNQYKGFLSSVQTNQLLTVTWKMWIQATNVGPGMFLFSVPVLDTNPSVTFNPPLAFLDTGSIVALTNGTSPQVPIGQWGSLAGTVMTNKLILDYPNATFSYSLNGQALATLPLGPYFTNVVGAIYFNGFERSAGSLGNRFAIDDVKVELTSSPSSQFQWAKRVASTTNTDFEIAIGMALDNQNNSYVTGWFDGTNDFGGVTLTNSSGGGQDIFVAKYDPAGALQWARRAGGNFPSTPGNRDAGRDAGRGLGVDTNGNVYVTGGFFGRSDFGDFTLTASGNRQFFLAKYDSAGTVQWVQQSTGGNGGNDGIYGTGLAVDGAGNSYAVGFAGNGAIITFGPTNLSTPTNSSESTFLIKYDTAGNVKWARLLAGSDEVYATKVALDVAGNVYVRGTFFADLNIGTSNLVVMPPGSKKNMFIAKFNSSGDLAWVQQAEGGNSDDGGVAVDQSQNVYITGAFDSAITFGSGVVLTNSGSIDAFLAKYNSAGVPQWARRVGFAYYLDVALDAQGYILAGGTWSSTAIDFSSACAMVAKYDPAGTLLWASSAGGSPSDPVSSLVAKCAVDSFGNCILAGWYQPTTTFGTHALQPLGNLNYFLTKLSVPDRPSLGIVFSNGVPGISFLANIGSIHALEWSSSIAATNTPWQTLTTLTVTNSPQFFFDTDAIPATKRFYRASPPVF